MEGDDVQLPDAGHAAAEAPAEADSSPGGSAKKKRKRDTAVQAAQAKIDKATLSRAAAVAKFEKKSAEWGEPAAGTERAKKLAEAEAGVEKKEAAVKEAEAALVAVQQKAEAAAVAASQAAEKQASDRERAAPCSDEGREEMVHSKFKFEKAPPRRRAACSGAAEQSTPHQTVRVGFEPPPC